MEIFNGKRVAFGVQTVPSIFLNLIFKLFFKYLNDFVVFWIDDLLIYSQTKEEHLKHLELVFEKFRGASINLKMSKCEFFKKEIEYLGHLVPGQGISPMKQKIMAITDMAPQLTLLKLKHIIGLIGYYKNSFPIFSNTVIPPNELTRINVPLKIDISMPKKLRIHYTGLLQQTPILIYPHLKKQYYLFMDSSKHSWSDILVQYAEQTKDDGTRIKIACQLLIKVEHSKVLNT